MTSLFPIFVVFATILAAIKVVEANCECGYSVSSKLYTELLETDFLHLPNITLDTDWAPQNYTVTPQASRGPYGKNASITNVISNPIAKKNTWLGEGLYPGSDAGLQLWVRGGIPQDGLIPMAELASTRADILYGSFRVAMKMTGTPGTCAAFFWVSCQRTFVIRKLAHAWIVLQRHTRDRYGVSFAGIQRRVESRQPRSPIACVGRSWVQRCQYFYLCCLPSILCARCRVPRIPL